MEDIKHAPLSVVRLIVEFPFLSIPPLHHTRAVTSGDPDLSSLFDFFGRSKKKKKEYSCKHTKD